MIALEPDELFFCFPNVRADVTFAISFMLTLLHLVQTKNILFSLASSLFLAACANLCQNVLLAMVN